MRRLYFYRFFLLKHLERPFSPFPQRCRVLLLTLTFYREEIEQRLLQSHQTHAEVLAWLKTKGVTIAPKTLKRRCKDWGATRRALLQMRRWLPKSRNSTFLHIRMMR